MRKTLFLTDCDGPLARFVDGFLDMVEEETGYRFGSEVVTEWEITDSPFFGELARELGRDPKELSAAVWRRVNRIGFCSSLKVVPGSQEAMEKLRTLGIHVEVITSPLVTSPTWMTERFEWLRRNYGFKKSEIHLIASKHRVPGDYLVDDKPSHVGSWVESSGDACLKGVGLLWAAPYNRGIDLPGLDVHNWDQVVELVVSDEDVRRLAF